jgi:hypothetical protein
MTKAKPTQPLEFKLSYDTAACLLDILTAQSVHAIRAEKEGFPSLMEQWKKVEPLFHYVKQYVEKAT